MRGTYAMQCNVNLELPDGEETVTYQVTLSRAQPMLNMFRKTVELVDGEDQGKGARARSRNE